MHQCIKCTNSCSYALLYKNYISPKSMNGLEQLPPCPKFEPILQINYYWGPLNTEGSLLSMEYEYSILSIKTNILLICSLDLCICWRKFKIGGMRNWAFSLLQLFLSEESKLWPYPGCSWKASAAGISRSLVCKCYNFSFRFVHHRNIIYEWEKNQCESKSRHV